jgi:hypothetical protein
VANKFAGGVLSFTFHSFAQDATVKEALNKTDSLVWVGLDYSMVRVIGNADTIRVPDLLFQDMPAKWNDLFLDERLELLANNLNKTIYIDIGGVTERNKTITTNQIFLTSDFKNAVEESDITQQDISTEVKGLKLKYSSGLGLTFIVDRFVSKEAHNAAHVANVNIPRTPINLTSKVEAVYVVFFDIASRQVLSAKREVRSINAGASYCNFWFGPIKDIDLSLYKYLD